MEQESYTKKKITKGNTGILKSKDTCNLTLINIITRRKQQQQTKISRPDLFPTALLITGAAKAPTYSAPLVSLQKVGLELEQHGPHASSASLWLSTTEWRGSGSGDTGSIFRTCGGHYNLWLVRYCDIQNFFKPLSPPPPPFRYI